MIVKRPSAERGLAQFGWLTSRHTFSFGSYYDPNHMGFGPLRVINDDHVAPGAGFGTHGHQDMEILTYVRDGALEHKDSLGSGSVLRAGDVQRMTAGTGIRHSEFNHSRTDPLQFLQIWILPETKGLTPGYEEQHLDRQAMDGRLLPIASHHGSKGGLAIHQDVTVYAVRLAASQTVNHALAPDRIAWLHVVEGDLSLDGEAMRGGDGAAIAKQPSLTLTGHGPAEALLFDMAP